jgi:hypothetical protein
VTFCLSVPQCCVIYCQPLQRSNGNSSILCIRDQVKRSNAQTVTLQTQTVSAEPLAVRTHPQEDGLRTHSESGTPQHRHKLIMCQSGPRLRMIITAMPGNSVFDAVIAMTQGLG